jgi:hypothetical protein
MNYVVSCYETAVSNTDLTHASDQSLAAALSFTHKVVDDAVAKVFQSSGETWISQHCLGY